MLTDKGLFLERPHSAGLGGVKRIYNLPNGYRLSLVNGPALRAYPYAWEAAVMSDGKIDYSTPLTTDVEVFDTDEEANAFIERAFAWAEAEQ